MSGHAPGRRRDRAIYRRVEGATRYGFARDNCQKFAREFVDWLTDNQHRPLPMMDADLGVSCARAGRLVGRRGLDHTLVAYAGATVADMQEHQVV